MEMGPTVVREREETISPEQERYGHDGEPRRVTTQVTLQPIAAPMILGLLSLASATFLVGAHLAGLYGGALPILLPFVAVFAGLAQFLAGMWSYKSRDVVGTALHGVWGAFLMGYGLFYYLAARAFLVPPTGAFVELGFWFVALAAISWVITVASSSRHAALVLTIGVLSLSATLAAIGYLSGVGIVVAVAGWVMLVGGIISWYTGGALLLNSSLNRSVLSVGRSRRSMAKRDIDTTLTEPGVVRYDLYE